MNFYKGSKRITLTVNKLRGCEQIRAQWHNALGPVSWSRPIFSLCEPSSRCDLKTRRHTNACTIAATPPLFLYDCTFITCMMFKHLSVTRQLEMFARHRRKWLSVWMGSCGLGRRPAAGSCKHGNEFSDSINIGEFCGQFSEYQLIK
jgi:hypothetical protein